MPLSKREKYIAIGVGAAVALLVVDETVLSPYFARLTSIDEQTKAAVQQKEDMATLFARRNDLKKVWTAMTRGGLSGDASAAESQALRAVLDWAGESGVYLTALKPDRTTDENQFEVISFHATATGSTPAIAKLLWNLETATIPVRLTDVQIAPRKEGTDDLTVQFGISTLCLRPGATDTAKPPAPSDAEEHS